jgi:hypothetical protein
MGLHRLVDCGGVPYYRSCLTSLLLASLRISSRAVRGSFTLALALRPCDISAALFLLRSGITNSEAVQTSHERAVLNS